MWDDILYNSREREMERARVMAGIRQSERDYSSQLKPKYTIDDLEIIKPFSLIDICKKEPCHDEFIRLLEKSTFCNKCWTDINGIREHPVLIDNLTWLIDKGFLRKKNKETKLKAGMRLRCSQGDYLVTQKGIFNLKSGNHWTDIKIFTLESLNKYSNTNFKIIKGVK